jgi:hypothetical protein
MNVAFRYGYLWRSHHWRFNIYISLNGARGLQVTYLTFSTHYYFPLNARTTRNAFLMMYILLYRSLLLDLGCGLTLVLVLSLVFIFAEYLLI